MEAARTVLIPSREDFLKTARRGDLVPIYREILADRLTPVSAYEKIAGDGGSFLLESVEGGERVGRYSFLGSDPFLTFRSKNRVVWLTEGDKTETFTLPPDRDALHFLQELLQRYKPVPMPGL